MSKISGRRAAYGCGTIRKKTVRKGGKEYAYWEARYTEGYDPGTGKQIQRSITGKTQKEVAQKLKVATASIDAGTYIPPNKLTVGEWLDLWAKEYLNSVKPFTVVSYTGHIKNHLKPSLGAIKLDKLDAHMIQSFYNKLSTGQSGCTPLSPKTIKNIHGVLHKALQQAISLGYIRANPTEACVLPKGRRKEITPLNEEESRAFLQAIKGHRFETLYVVTLFTGMREGEVIGLKWDRVDFQRGTIIIDKQLQYEKKKGAKHVFAPLKNDKARIITPATWVMDLLRIHREAQEKQRQMAREAWEDSGLVFTNALGHHLSNYTVYRDFKKVVATIGRPDARFHDLRHGYAVAAIRAGDDIKTIQGNLGHATATFTLDVYGHVTEQMRRDSATRMDRYIEDVLGVKA